MECCIEKKIPAECVNATIETTLVISKVNKTHKHIRMDAVHNNNCINYTSDLQECKSICQEPHSGKCTSKWNQPGLTRFH